LRLSDEDVEKYRGQLEAILEYVDKLRELDTSGVPEVARGIEATNVFRDDLVELCDPDTRERILKALPQGMKFDPLMTLYLTDITSADEIRKAKASGVVHAVKLYPAGATTNSDAGVTDLRKTYAALDEMQRCGMPLLVHGEVTSADIDIFDREAVFIERVMQPLLKDLPSWPASRVQPTHGLESSAADIQK